MIYVTGDTHGDWNRFAHEILPLARDWGARDTLLIAGDFGFVFRPEGDPAEAECMKKLASLPFTVAFCDGNHENFPRLMRYPVEQWQGGTVHRLGPKLFHLLRGETYLIERKSLLVMGGGRSIDRVWRTPGLSWWPEEMPTNAEYQHLRQRVQQLKRVDLILTHAAPASVMRMVGFDPGAELPLNTALEGIRQSLPYGQWFFGHLHLDRDFGPNLHGLYHRVMRADGTALQTID